MQEQIKELQQAIQDGTHKLEDIRQKRQRADEDIIAWYSLYLLILYASKFTPDSTKFKI